MEQPEKKARTAQESASEMAPFIIYTAIPLIITIAIAFIFGTR